VENMVHASKKVRDERVEVVVRVGNDADSHGAWCVLRSAAVRR
jgi:hypothetical protein